MTRNVRSGQRAQEDALQSRRDLRFRILLEPGSIRILIRQHSSENRGNVRVYSRQHDLGCTVPPSRNVFRHEPSLSSIRFCRRDTASESEIADFEVAVCVEEEVGRLQVAVDDICRVESFESAESSVQRKRSIIEIYGTGSMMGTYW